jgi:hypothetical protein
MAAKIQTPARLTTVTRMLHTSTYGKLLSCGVEEYGMAGPPILLKIILGMGGACRVARISVVAFATPQTAPFLRMSP